MLSLALTSAISSIIPYWSNDLIKLLNIGNEYSIIFNLIFGELIKKTGENVTDINLIIIFVLVISVGTLYKFNLIKSLFGNKTNKITIVTSYKHFDKINKYLLKKYNIKN